MRVTQDSHGDTAIDSWSGTPASGQGQDAAGRELHQHQESVSGTLRISDMVSPRKIPPGSGWRKLVYRLSFQNVNLGESPAERHYRDLQNRIRRHIRKQYVIGVVSGKGGVGKTTMAACIGGVFRECRPDNVVAIDAAPGFGTLAGRIDESPPGDYSAVLNDTDVQGYADIREHLGQNSVGLDVLAGNRVSDQPRPLAPSMFTGVLSRLRRTHTVIVVDTSDDLEHPVMKAVLEACDALVFVSGLTADTSLPVTRAIDLLRSMGYHELVSRSTVVLNDSRNKFDGDSRDYLAERFRQSGATVEFMPFDPYLAKGGIIDTRHELKKATRLRLFEIAASLADKYIPDTDRPR
ncbi:MinD/ParA family ATP-binding protein [Mycobacterium sp.]|uniref:MinD/ParA family ATP-binding protein n=1 Tax=Mycobacterium sp. TaxID=1785 RepID=UPI003A863F61